MITLELARRWVQPRVKDKRFQHICGVAAVAREIAQAAGADIHLAELAGWLHDACKEVKDKELVRMAEKHGLKLHPIEREHGHLLHGPVAAEVVREELKVNNEDLLNAIREHTLGAVHMSNLSKVVFLADCLEAGRPREYTDPIWSALDLEGTVDLDRAIYKACDQNLMHLIESGKPIHPLTVEVRNYYQGRVHERDQGKV